MDDLSGFLWTVAGGLAVLGLLYLAVKVLDHLTRFDVTGLGDKQE